MTLFRRNSVRCFFCQSIVPFPNNVKNFKCTSCSCWNRYSDGGEIFSDEPAMHDEHLNAKSFAKRGSPSKDQLPSLYGPGPFCHNCQTNQMLQMNLLSHYLPDPDNSEYKSRVEMLPAYRESLNARYPSICETCMPIVEDKIRRKEHMARVQALGGWLSKGKERQRRISNEIPNQVKVVSDSALLWWRLRGCLWGLSTALSIVGHVSAISGLRLFYPFHFLQPVLPFIAVVSLLWAAWDPTYAKLRHAQQQSRHVKVQGKSVYKVLQVLVWISRLICSIIFSVLWFFPSHGALLRLSSNKTLSLTLVSIEILSLIGSATVLRIHQPPPVRLVDTSTHKLDKFRSGTPASRSGTPLPVPSPKLPAAVPENELLTSLSLSSKPVILTLHKPVFGRPSLKGSASVVKEEINSEDMDWTPTNAASGSAFAQPATETGNWLKPQTFFAPEKTTGLEGLLEGARIRDDPMVVDAPDTNLYSSKKICPILMQYLLRWRLTYILSLAVFVICFFFTNKIPWSWTKS